MLPPGTGTRSHVTAGIPAASAVWLQMLVEQKGEGGNALDGCRVWEPPPCLQSPSAEEQGVFAPFAAQAGLLPG